jgi:hypothetical protein
MPKHTHTQISKCGTIKLYHLQRTVSVVERIVWFDKTESYAGGSEVIGEDPLTDMQRVAQVYIQ